MALTWVRAGQAHSVLKWGAAGWDALRLAYTPVAILVYERTGSEQGPPRAGGRGLRGV